MPCTALEKTRREPLITYSRKQHRPSAPTASQHPLVLPIAASRSDDAHENDKPLLHSTPATRAPLRACHLPLSVTRKILQPPIPLQPDSAYSTSSPALSTAEKRAIIRGSDGFVASELLVVPKPRKKRARKSRHAIPLRTLEVVKGPTPDVDFISAVSTDQALHFGSDVVAPEEQHQRHAGIDESTFPASGSRLHRHISTIDGTPRYGAPSVLASDSFDDETYEMELLLSEHDSSLGAEHGRLSEPTTVPGPVVKSLCRATPGQVPPRLLNLSGWIGVDEEIIDDDPPCVRRTRTTISSDAVNRPELSRQVLNPHYPENHLSQHDTSMMDMR